MEYITSFIAPYFGQQEMNADNKTLYKLHNVRGDGFCLIHSVMISYLSGNRECLAHTVDDIIGLLKNVAMDFAPLERWQKSYVLETLNDYIYEGKKPDQIHGEFWFELFNIIFGGNYSFVVVQNLDNFIKATNAEQRWNSVPIQDRFGNMDSKTIYLYLNNGHYQALIPEGIELSEMVLPRIYWKSMMEGHPEPETLKL